MRRAIDYLYRYRPAAAARHHVLAAALMWTGVGAGLVYFGVRWAAAGAIPYPAMLATAAVAVGLLKAHVVLRRASSRAVDRIQRRGDDRCIGGFLSWKMWLVVVLMVLAGRALRGGLLPLAVTGLIYIAIGVALLSASTRLWRGWYRFEEAPE